MGVSCTLYRQLSSHDRLRNHQDVARRFSDQRAMEIYEHPRTSPKSFRNVSLYPHPPFAVLLPEALQSYTPCRRAIVSLHQRSRYDLSLTFSYSSIPPVPQIVFYQAGVGTDSNPSQALLDGWLSICFCIISMTITHGLRSNRGGSRYVAERDTNKVSFDFLLQRIRSKRLTHS